jgi:hypothetical protein
VAARPGVVVGGRGGISLLIVVGVVRIGTYGSTCVSPELYQLRPNAGGTSANPTRCRRIGTVTTYRTLDSSFTSSMIRG